MAGFSSSSEYEQSFDPRLYLESYFHLGSGSIGDDLIYLALNNFHKKFSSGEVSGKTLIDIGTAPSIYQLLSACEVFQEVGVTWHTQRELRELQAWLNAEPGAFDWSSAIKHVCQLEGGRATVQEKAEKLRGKVKQVLFCDVSQGNPLSPLELPPADCLTSTVCLEGACRTPEAYGLALRNLSTLLRPGGHLLMAGDLGANFFEVGEHKIFSLNVNEKFIKEALSNNGYRVIEMNTTGKEAEEAGNSDYEGNYFVHAQKL